MARRRSSRRSLSRSTRATSKRPSSARGTPRLEQALRLTRFVAAVASTPNAKGIYWASAGLVHEPADLLDEIGSAGADYLPVMLWVSLNTFHVKKRRHVTTQGLAQ